MPKASTSTKTVKKVRAKKQPKKQTKVQQLKILRKSLARLYNSRCFVCHRKFGIKFTFHHLWYIDNDIVYYNYKTPLAYYEALQHEIKKNPKRFLLLCNTHHRWVEFVSKWNPDSYRRAIKAVEMTKKGMYYEGEAKSAIQEFIL